MSFSSPSQHQKSHRQTEVGNSGNGRQNWCTGLFVAASENWRQKITRRGTGTIHEHLLRLVWVPRHMLRV